MSFNWKKFILVFAIFMGGFTTHYVVDNYVVSYFNQRDWSGNDFTVKSWLPSNYNKETALVLSDIFIQSINVEHENPAALVAYTRLRIISSLTPSELETWKPFLEQVSFNFQEQLTDQSMEAHILAWLRLSASLRKVS